MQAYTIFSPIAAWWHTPMTLPDFFGAIFGHNLVNLDPNITYNIPKLSES
jgi:hypothetical protein